MSRYKIILNPAAGKGHAQQAVLPIEAALNQYKLDYEISITEYPEHATEIALQAAREGFNYVIAAGGDGTVNETINGILKAKAEGIHPPVFGVIPIGSGNDFAFGANIPVGIEESCALLASLPRKWIDLGKISGGKQADGLYFGNGVGIGFDAVVGFLAAKMKLTGMLSYLVAALKTIFIYYKSPSVELTMDDQTLTLNPLMISIMNGRRMGGGFMMTPKSKIDDGAFSLCVVRNVPQIAMFGLIAKFMKATHVDDPNVSMLQAKKITARALKGTLPIHADGVTVCEEGQEVTIELIPGGLEIITRLD